MLRQLSRFASVGVVATLLHVTVALIAKEVISLPPQVANFTGFIAAVVVSFFGHARVTFEVKGYHAVRFARFVVVALAGLAASSSITFLVHTKGGQSFWLAMAITAAFVPLLTYFIARFWVFAALGKTERVWPGILLSLVFAVVFFLVFSGRYISHDVAWYLVAMRQWLEGAALYVDIVEVNPPLAMYLVLPAIWLADFFGISDTNAMYAFTATVLFISLSWVVQILSHEKSLTEPKRLAALFLTALAVTVPAMANVAQREHLMVILALPYVFGFLVLPRPDSGSSGVARAGFAAIGLSMKPHFMLIPIAITVVEIIKVRSFRPIFAATNLTILLFGLVYVFLVATVHPAYFYDIIPLGIRVYAAYGYEPLTVLIVAKPELLVAFLGLLIIGAIRTKGAGFLAALSFAAYLIYLAQWTGYSYQSLPISIFIALSAGWLVVNNRLRFKVQLLSLLLFFYIVGSAITNGFYYNPWIAYLTEVLEGIAPPQKVMALSSDLREAFPYVVESNAVWTSRYPALWTIAGTLNELLSLDCSVSVTDCENLQAILDQSRRAIVDDLVGRNPNILLVMNRVPYIDDRAFRFISFLSADPRFLPFLAGFREIERNEVFSLWVLSDPSQ